MKARTFNIDSDVLIYKAALLSEVATDWSDGCWTLEANIDDAIANLDRQVADIKSVLQYDESKDRLNHFISDPDRSRLYRKQLLPTYKASRATKRRPMLLAPLWEHVHTVLGGMWREGLEGDDMLGVKQTGKSICVSIDKDMHTVPGMHFNTMRPEEGVVTQSVEDADAFFHIQALAGDATDNYSGCPGIGMKTAAKVLGEPAHTIEATSVMATRGKDKGSHKIVWVKREQNCTPWDTILSYYRKAGVADADALIQARMARILRHEDMPAATSEIRLWTPTN